MTAPTPREVQEVATQQATVDLRYALKAAHIGEANGYRMAKRGELPFPVLRAGRIYRVPTAGLLAALGLSNEDQQLTA